MNTLPPSIVPARRRVHRKRTRAASPAVALTLVSASYDDGAMYVALTFDRAVTIGGINVGAVTLDDGTFTESAYEGSGAAVLLGPNTVRVNLAPAGGSSSPDVVLDAGADTGIVAADDGGAWAGANSLPLPFP